MRSWRPGKKCLYVIPEIHGNLQSLQIIFNRILPLRFSIGQKDKIVMLGDYIDYGPSSKKVIDLLIMLKQELKENLICLSGNHEQYFLQVLKGERKYEDWLINQGGLASAENYVHSGIKPQQLTANRFAEFIPKTHLDFFQNLPSHTKIDQFVLFHGSFDLNNPEQTGDNHYIFGNYSADKFKNFSPNERKNLFANSPLTYIGAHNIETHPIISEKYIMLGGAAPKDLILFDAYSRTCAMIKTGKSSIYNHKYKEIK